MVVCPAELAIVLSVRFIGSSLRSIFRVNIVKSTQEDEVQKAAEEMSLNSWLFAESSILLMRTKTYNDECFFLGGKYTISFSAPCN